MNNLKLDLTELRVQKPAKNEEDILGILPQERSEPYNMQEIIDRLVDADSFEGYKTITEKLLFVDMPELMAGPLVL